MQYWLGMVSSWPASKLNCALVSLGRLGLYKDTMVVPTPPAWTFSDFKCELLQRRQRCMGAKQLQQAPTNTCCDGEDGVCSLHSVLQAAGAGALQELARLLAQVLTMASLQMCSTASVLLLWGRCRLGQVQTTIPGREAPAGCRGPDSRRRL